ncbi:unnamed protein product [Prunus brigantina]
MAADVAQFLRNKLLASLSETESELSGAVLISDLGAIKDILISIDTQRLAGDYYCRFISVLLDLTDALTKCQVFSHEWKKHSHHKTHLIFNHLSLRKICFVRKMKKRLAAIKRIFEAEFMKKEERIYNLRESSSRPDPEENLEIELPVVEAEVVGFDEQLWKIGSFLLKSSPSSGAGFAAVGIVGMAGAGKTTLVREVLSWWMVLGKFSPIIWLRLSNIIKENKQVEEEIEVSIVKCMLSKLDHDAVADGDGIIQEEEKTISSNNSGHLLAALLERLNQHLSGKSYLIVLDDVWHMNDFYSDLGQLLEVQEGDKKVGDRLSHGLPKGSGGAVIITSRIPEVVEAMVVPAQGSDKHCKSLIISLKPLDRESCWNIYKDTAFGYQQHLEKVENEIKDLCYGLPLAARTLAEIMSQNSQNFEYCSQLNLHTVLGRGEVVNWILGVICDLKLPESPNIVPVPAIDGCDEYCGIPASFGWDISNISRLRSFLVDVVLAKPMKTDSWHCFIRTHSSLKADNPTFYGRFWSHFILNEVLYTFVFPNRDGLTSVAIVKVLNHLGQWEMLHIPERYNIESFHFLNLPREDPEFIDETWEYGKLGNSSFIDDGRLEVIGFEYCNMEPLLLDQVRGIRFEFTKHARGHLSITIDGGEPDFKITTDELVEIEISYHGQVNILAGPNCQAKSIHHSKLPVQIAQRSDT